MKFIRQSKREKLHLVHVRSTTKGMGSYRHKVLEANCSCGKRCPSAREMEIRLGQH